MKKGGKKAAKGAGAATKVVTAEALVAQGNNAMASMQPELAVKFFKRAHDMCPENTDIMDALADVHLQLGDQESALDLLLMSTSLAPDVNPFKWLYLAQLQEGEDSVTTYLKAISILELTVKSGADDADVSHLYI